MERYMLNTISFVLHQKHMDTILSFATQNLSTQKKQQQSLACLNPESMCKTWTTQYIN